MGFLYILLSVGGFSVIGVAAKVADLKRCRPMPLSALMCAWALLAAGLFAAGTPQRFQAPTAVYWIALPFGAAAVIGALAFLTGVRYGKISTSWLIINLSAAVPAVGSVLLYREPVSARKLLALSLVLVSIVLLWLDRQRDRDKEVPGK